MTLIFAQIGTSVDYFFSFCNYLKVQEASCIFFQMVLLVVHEHNFKVYYECKELNAERVSYLTSMDRTCSPKALCENVMGFQE